MGRIQNAACAVRPIFQSASQNLPDNQALQVQGIYDQWAAGVDYGGENEPQIVRRPGGLYRIRQPHTSQEGWEPENYPAGWKRIDLEHCGTKEDPIPAAMGMEYFEGKYYTEDGVLYICTRDSLNPMDYLPSQLITQYFEVVT